LEEMYERLHTLLVSKKCDVAEGGAGQEVRGSGAVVPRPGIRKEAHLMACTRFG